MTQPKGFVLHWDGKLLPEIAGKEKVERLPIIVTHNGSEQLIAVPKLDGGHGDEIADGIILSLLNWNLCDSVEAICCDTCAANTGVSNGACVLLEEHLGRDLMYLMCRHHISELCLKAVFDLKMPKSTAPEVPLFEKFAQSWNNLDKKKFESGIADKNVAKFLSDDERNDIIDFCTRQLRKKQCRDDYKEFLQLVLIFLDAPNARNISLRLPGPTHHARWMAKAIYSLKMYLFRKQFLTKSEVITLRGICIFIVRLYVKFWFGCSNAIEAPNQDLQFIKDAITYAEIDHDISTAIIDKFKNHLWYLSDEAVGFAFFDENVTIEVKRKMVERLKSQKPSKGCKRIIVKTVTEAREKFPSKDLSEFVTANTLKFFDRFGINSAFLEFDPSSWSTKDEYKDAIHICRNIRVVNDAAERGVQLMTEFNSILTNNEEQKQFLLHVVAAHRKRYPSAVKKVLREK